MDGSSLAQTVALPRDATALAMGDAEVPAVFGEFELVRWLGGGGMGVVFEARHLVLGRRVALKLVRPELAGSDEAQARLVREAQALARLNHRHVVTLFEVGVSRNHVFLAMELVEGGTLREWMQTPRDWREIVDKFVAFGSGLAAAHDLGLIHRDVNPSNVFLARDGTPKLGDFGLARSEAEGDAAAEAWTTSASLLASRLSAPGTVLGTPAYMAPEQSGGYAVDARADQFAFCRSLHEALTGALPEDGVVASTVPGALRSILSRGLAHDASARFRSTRRLLSELLRARRGARSLVRALGRRAM